MFMCIKAAAAAMTMTEEEGLAIIFINAFNPSVCFASRREKKQGRGVRRHTSYIHCREIFHACLYYEKAKHGVRKAVYCRFALSSHEKGKDAERETTT